MPKKQKQTQTQTHMEDHGPVRKHATSHLSTRSAPVLGKVEAGQSSVVCAYMYSNAKMTLPA